MVTLSIIALISTIVVRSQSSYTQAAALTNLSDEIASRIVQAQIYGIAVRERTPGSADFSGSYGLSMSLLSGGSNTAYLSFIDKNGNQIYDGSWDCEMGGAAECLEKVDIQRGNYIHQFCVIRSTGGEICGTAERADISYARPFIEARIRLFDSGGQVYSPPNMIGVKIVLKSETDLSRSVSVYQSGQISSQ